MSIQDRDTEIEYETIDRIMSLPDPVTRPVTRSVEDAVLASANITRRPPNVAFRPERIHIPLVPIVTPGEPSAKDWVINDIGVVNLFNEDLLADAYADDRRKAGRRIRQQRRRLRRINAEFGHGPGEGVPQSILGMKVRLR